VGGRGRTGSGIWDFPHRESSASGVRQAETAGGSGGCGEATGGESAVRGSAPLTVDRILPFFGADTLTTEITSRRIEQYAQWRREKVKGTTVDKELACIRHMMKKAEEWGKLPTSPARKVKDLPDGGQIRERFLAPEEYGLLVSQAGSKSSRPWTLPGERFEDLAEFIMLDCNTGLRVMEVLTREFSDVDWERRILRVRNKPHLNFHIKNYQERHIRLNNHAQTALQSMLAKKHGASEFVIHKRDGDRWGPFTNPSTSRCDDAGSSRSRPSISRFTRFGTRLVHGWPWRAFRCGRSRS